ncbi:scarecrow-like protein 21 [Typha latifolia]|uniref:scarecrow-like protein 21 n=1 Tax=Typha latifolia TaxID=4733 RepID=UPI003C2E689C
MKENKGEELLSLSLGINTITTTTAWCSKKRKGREDFMASDRKFFNLLQIRDQMLRATNTKRYSCGVEDGKNSLQVIHLLLAAAAAAVDTNGGDVNTAVDALGEVYKTVSLKGDPIQRVAVYFADALAARILTPRSPFYQSFMLTPTPEVEFSAFTDLYRASPYYQFAHFTANQAIVEAFEDEEKENGGRLHVIDFDVSYGFQWPSLIQSLSDKATSSKPIALRITGFGRSIQELKETEMRLVHFANCYDNLFLKFEGIFRGDDATGRSIKIEENATVVVNSVFYLRNLRSSTEISDALAVLYSLNPSLVVLVEKEGRQRQGGFLSRFMESLNYSAAMFDSLNECLPADSMERLNIEKNSLGRDIKHAIVNGDEEDEYLNHEVLQETWKERMERIGFEEMKLSSRSVSQARLLLKIKSQYSTTDHGSNGGFRVIARDEGKTISLGWQDRILITASGFTRRHL